jgi:hypothetical protein
MAVEANGKKYICCFAADADFVNAPHIKHFDRLVRRNYTVKYTNKAQHLLASLAISIRFISPLLDTHQNRDWVYSTAAPQEANYRIPSDNSSNAKQGVKLIRSRIRVSRRLKPLNIHVTLANIWHENT